MLQVVTGILRDDNSGSQGK